MSVSSLRFGLTWRADPNQLSVADELEGRLAAVNQSSKLLKPVYLSQPRPEVDGEQDEQRAYKNGSEKERRSRERDSMERISRFFKARPRQQWSRQDLLGLSEIVFLSMDAIDCLPNSFQVPCSSSMALEFFLRVSSRSSPPLRVRRRAVD